VRTSQEERNAALARAAEAEKAAAQARREFQVDKEELGERVRGLDDLLEGTQDRLNRAEKTLAAKTEALTKKKLEAKQDSQQFQVEKAKLENALSTSKERVEKKESEAAELETALSTSEERVKKKEAEAAELETSLSTSEERVKTKEVEAAELAAALAEATRRKGLRERTRNLFARIRGKGSKDRFGNFRRSS
jgi:chromosome segregation ATPase